MELNKDQCEELVGFFKNVGLTVLGKDDIEGGTKGWVCFKCDKINSKGEMIEYSIAFGYRFAEPVKNYFLVPQDKADEMIKECIEKNWIKCDNPIKRLVQFRDLEKSECRQFTLSVIKGLGCEAKVLFQSKKNKE